MWKLFRNGIVIIGFGLFIKVNIMISVCVVHICHHFCCLNLKLMIVRMRTKVWTERASSFIIKVPNAVWSSLLTLIHVNFLLLRR